MRWSMLVARVFGIPLRLHFTLLVVFPLFVWALATQFGQTLTWGAAFYLALFACVTLHELAHCKVAQWYGVRVREIVLLPFGGIASLERIPEEPRKEAAIAIAGPAFNILLAIALYAFMVWVPHIMFIDPLSDPRAVFDNPTPFTQFVASAFLANVMLVVFNLLPAFPTDGGRLLRALLVALRTPYLKATAAAVVVSKLFLGLFVILAFVVPNYWLLLIAAVLYIGATGEERAVRTREGLKQLRAGHLLPQRPVGITPDTSLGQVVPLLLADSQLHFPVLERGRLLGVLSHQDLTRAIKREGGSDIPAAAVMRPPVVVSPADSLADIQRHMEERGVSVACILRHGRFAGLVSQDGLKRLLAILDAERV